VSRTRLITALVVLLLAAAVPGAVAQCPGEGDCCAANGTPGCEDLACCLEVCAIDPYCCDVEWDSLCANVANGTCAACGAGCPGSGNCCAANGTPGCDDFTCCLQVCASDPFCCDTVWDSTCALAAQGACSSCSGGCPGGGDCCADNGSPGCEDESCCEMVCDALPFCCESAWDGACAAQAQEICFVCQPVCQDPFLVQDETQVVPAEALAGQTLTVVYRVTNAGECPTPVALACAIRPVAGGAFTFSPECDRTVVSAPGSIQEFSRCFNLPSPAAAGLYEVCYEIQDPGVGVFDGFCRADLIIRAQGDINGDGNVNLIDFLILLEQWGPCGDCANCPADFDGDCMVDVVDFLIMLANWG
jgi:hypothetical protein